MLKSACLLRADPTEVMSSGNDVPIGIIVKPMILSEIPILFAIYTALSTVKEEPK